MKNRCGLKMTKCSWREFKAQIDHPVCVSMPYRPLRKVAISKQNIKRAGFRRIVHSTTRLASTCTHGLAYTMSFKLEVAQIEDLPKIIAAEWNSFENPPEPIFRLYCPVTGAGRTKALADNIAQQQKSFISQDSNMEISWVMAIQDGHIIGGAQWVFIAHDSVVEADIESLANRHREDGAKIFATESFKILREKAGSTREELRGPRPYASLGTFFTAPEYRKNGVGSLLMEWGLIQANEKGMDIWIEAVPSAVSFYERHGFVPQETIHLSPGIPTGMSEHDKTEWDIAVRLFLPITAVIMCRIAKLV